MKNRLLLAGLLGLAFSSLSAQYWQVEYLNANINPGELNIDDEYPVGGGLAATWTTLLGPSASPAWSATTNLPFAFNFNGSPVTSFKASNSAVVTFDVATALAAPAFTSVALPAATVPDKSVCILGIKGTGTNDNVVTKTFGTAPNRQFWITFSSYSNATANNYFYFSIVLEETTNRIYVVDQRANGTATNSIGIQVDATTAYSLAGSPNVGAYAGTSPTPNDNTYYVFNPGAQPAFDMAATAITTKKYILPGNTNITGTIRNLGTTTITSATLNYTIDGGAVQTAALTGLNIASLASYNFTHSVPWNATSGTHLVDVYATNLNGSNPDINPTDDHKLKNIYVMSSNQPRIPLFEVFTSSTCAPCNPGNANYHSVVDPKPAAEYVSIKFQQNFPGTGDPYATTEAINRRSAFYGINSIPRMEIDGGWDQNASSFTTALYNSAKTNPSQYMMSGNYALNGQTIEGKVKFNPLITIDGAKLHIAVLEKQTTGNVKSNGETEFFHVMKKMIPSETGTEITPTLGVWDSLSFSYTFNGNYRLPADGATANIINHTIEHSVEDFQNLYVVAWVQGSDKVVYQAANLNSPTTGIADVSGIMSEVAVYPNPTTDIINVQVEMKNADNVLATLIDMNGQVVESTTHKMNTGKNKLTFNVSNLATGIYNVLLFDSKQNVSIHEVIVAH